MNLTSVNLFLYKYLNMNPKRKVTYPNGDIYYGDIKNDIKEGQGKYCYSNGDLY